MVHEIIHWLKSYSLSISKHYLRIRLESHPDYPSLVAIEDTLAELGITSYACHGTKEELAQEGKHFLAHFNLEEKNLRHFKSVDQAEKQMTEFDKYWTGNVMFIDRINGYRNEQHDKLYKSEKLNRIFSTLLMSIFIGGLFLLLSLHGNISMYLFFVTGLTGIYLNWLITEKEIGIRNSVSDKICGMIKFNRCESVLFSKGAKLFKWLSWGDIGLTYFGSTLIYLYYLLISGNSNGIYVSYWISIAALLFLPYSLFYQWKVIKQWCALCLGVLALLFISGVFSIFQINIAIELDTLVSGIFIFLALGIVVLSIWRFISYHRQIKINSLSYEINEAKLKRNSKIFTAVLEKSNYNPKNLPLLSEPIRFGSNVPKYSIVIACNPYCNPCANAHHTIEKLFEQYSDKISVAIRFALYSNNKDDQKVQAVEKILNASDINPYEAIKNWYKYLDYGRYNSLYPNNDKNVDAEIKKFIGWSKEEEIKGTPTFYVNGYRMPEMYSWSDLTEVLAYELKQT